MKFPEIDGIDPECVTAQYGGWFIYSESVSVPDGDEPHDVVEPAYYEAQNALREKGCDVDYGRSGCDHDSFWIMFKLPDNEVTTLERGAGTP